jgi:hypothetical protein
MNGAAIFLHLDHLWTWSCGSSDDPVLRVIDPVLWVADPVPWGRRTRSRGSPDPVPLTDAVPFHGHRTRVSLTATVPPGQCSLMHDNSPGSMDGD